MNNGMGHILIGIFKAPDICLRFLLATAFHIDQDKYFPLNDHFIQIFSIISWRNNPSQGVS